LGSQEYLKDKILRKQLAKALEEKIYGQLHLCASHSSYDTLEDQYKKQIILWYNKYLEKVADQKRHLELSKPADQKTAIFEEIDTTSINTYQCREVGAEWLCLNLAQELKIDQFFEAQGFVQKEIQMALLTIISRAVLCSSEHKTAQLLEQNTALYELFATIKTPPNRFSLYNMAHKLSGCFDDFTDHVYEQSLDMFNLKDTLMIYDLTNTYFKGRKLGSVLAKFGRSKEKRSDCKLMSFSAVVNEYGFLRYSKILQGNISESATLMEVIRELKSKTKGRQLDKIVVMDAGITTEENLAVLRKNGEKYACVS
jgi:hypothetical protein